MPARAQAAIAAGAAGAAAAWITPTVPVLELANVSKVYPGSPPVRALDDVSLAVTAGELAAVGGPSGAGKATVRHPVGTLDLPTVGAVRRAGAERCRST